MRGGGRAEERCKEHQVSAAISSAAGAAGELQMFQDDVRLRMWRGLNVQFAILQCVKSKGQRDALDSQS